MQNTEKLYKLMQAAGVVHGIVITEPLLELYWNLLKEFTDDQVDHAFLIVLKSSKFFPKPAEIVAAIDGTPDSQVERQWIEVLEKIRSVGAYRSVEFADPVTSETIRVMGGWPRLCDTLIDDIKWKRQDFIRTYEALKVRPQEGGKLLGLHEQDKERKGISAPQGIGQIAERLKI